MPGIFPLYVLRTIIHFLLGSLTIAPTYSNEGTVLEKSVILNRYEPFHIVVFLQHSLTIHCSNKQKLLSRETLDFFRAES